MDWRNSNDDLTRQSEARREREGQRFENGIHDRGGFGGMRQGPGGDPLARMRGAQRILLQIELVEVFLKGNLLVNLKVSHNKVNLHNTLSQHEDWMDKVFKVFTRLWKHLTSYVWPVLSESDDMFRSDYKLRKGLTAALFILWSNRRILLLIWFVHKICYRTGYPHFARRRWSKWWFVFV